ncbi:MAG: GYD domain-containing protein [Variibacter sp.]|nr:GYD domain-containing protein [Variibacter sp.]
MSRAGGRRTSCACPANHQEQTPCRKYLIEATYTAEGLKGLQKDKATGRVAAVRRAVEALGGKLEVMYYCLGERDVIVVVEAPDNAAVAALNIAVSASGLARTKTTALLTPEETDQALATNITYQPPGQAA